MGGFAVNVDLPFGLVTVWNVGSLKFEPLPDGKTGSFSFNVSVMDLLELDPWFGGVDDVAELALEAIAWVTPLKTVLSPETELLPLTCAYTDGNEHILT